MDTRWKQYRIGRTLKHWGDSIPSNRDDDWAYKVARYMDMRIDNADSGVNIIPVDLYETDDGFIIQAPAVGINPGQVEVQYQEDALVIRAKVDEYTDRKKPSSRIIGERPHGLFARRLTLPGTVNAEHASARVENGLLTIQLPRCSQEGYKKVHILFADPTGDLVAAFD
jgi:HSP20 family protein